MSRKILLIALLLACALPVSARRPQIEWGLMAGIHIPNYETNMSRAEMRDKLGWQVGMATAVDFGAWGIDPQLFYVRQGVRINSEQGQTFNIKSHSIDVPILVSLRVLKPFRFFAGPVFTVMNDCKLKSGGDMLDFTRIRPTVSYTIGAGVKVVGVYIDLRFNGEFRGKRNVLLPDNAGKIDRVRTYNVALSIGHMF